MGKTAATVLLNLFNNGNERSSILICQQHTIHDPEGLEKLQGRLH